MISRRRRIPPDVPLEQRLTAAAVLLRERAKKMQPGADREELLRRARQIENASHVSEWLLSPVSSHRSNLRTRSHGDDCP